ncbi:alpha/beta hydrolase [Sporosarcina thermotolerans]|uniref:Alpha/beta hydrolase n=1 Tax=Sporosarcina thermotolerans TaxID=633404 RepID=A0AAW9AE06_9BACL|nr:alpha/beta hydrolase [Sporosarcina thermotolerans]MDW0117876.1 alpha/beta hydrolase [Sporosarcina thermotolerans]WHT49320.1 alpha/beta hydrolase [Sporosarcina thermotolerans]
MKTTIVYKQGQNFELKGDFYAVSEKSRPLIVFIHGGGLIWGSREDINQTQIEFFHKAGFNIFSIDYRLAPESKLPDIKDDIDDALFWVKNEGVNQFDYDSERIAVIGSSAGGYLALLSGTLTNKPRTIVSFYGYGDITGDWAVKPSPHYTSMTNVPRELAKMLLSKDIISVGPIEKRYAIYMHARQHGVWIEELSGLIPFLEKDKLKKYSPLFNIHADYPPTLLLHGTNDEDVPYEQAVLFAESLQENGIEGKLITIPEGKHQFDNDWELPVVQNAFNEVLTFLNDHLK